MTIAICFNCGSEKLKVLSTCRQCNAIPKTYGEKSQSLVLSQLISSQEQLNQFSSEIKNGRSFSAPENLYIKSRELMNAPAFLEKINKCETKQTPNNIRRVIIQSSKTTGIGPAVSQNISMHTPKITALHRNAFYILSATVHDDRRRIVDLAEEKGLTINSDICNKARGDLTNPRNRLAIEMAWMPGVSPALALEMLNSLNTLGIVDEEKSLTAAAYANRQGLIALKQRRDQRKNIPTLAYANLLAASLELLSPEMESEKWSDWIVDFAIAFDKINPEDTYQVINSDREISNFPLIKEIELINEELAERRRSYTGILTSALGKFSTPKLVEIITRATDSTTNSGENHAPLLIDELIDWYEIEANRFLQPESENLKKVIKSVKDAAFRNKTAVLPLVDQLEKMVRKWDSVAQPIQLSMKARGLDHELSHEIASDIRNLAIDLFNNYEMLNESKRLTSLIQELFAELPEVLERVEQDADALEDISLHNEVRVIQKLIESIQNIAKRGERVAILQIDQLEAATRKWDKVAKPLRLSSLAQGMDHEPSKELAYSIRSLAIDLFNKHDMLSQSKRLLGFIQEIFAGLPEISERIKQDIEALEEICQSLKQNDVRKDELAREITYSAEVGIAFKNTLGISPHGIFWKDQRYSLDSITRVRWGGVKNSVNGISTGTIYTVAFGDTRTEAVVTLRRREVYSTFVDKLWRAVCVRLLTEAIEAIKAGQEIRIGDVVIRDESVTLVKHKLFGSNETVRYEWHQIHCWSADGVFHLGARGDEKTYSASSYIHTPNAHILEQIIRMAFKKPGMRKLSDVF
jgi:hypothetical protein